MKFCGKGHDKKITDYINSLDNPVIDVTDHVEDEYITPAQSGLLHGNLNVIAEYMGQDMNGTKEDVYLWITQYNKATGNCMPMGEFTVKGNFLRKKTMKILKKDFSKVIEGVYILMNQINIIPKYDPEVYESGLVEKAREVFGN